MWKLQPPLKKVTPSLPSTPPLKVQVLSSPSHLFENLVGGSTPPPPPPFPAERGDTHYVYRTDISHRHVTIKQIIPNKLLLNHFTHESKNLSQKNRRKAFIVWISSSEPLIASVFFLKMYKILQMFETLQHFKNTRTFCEKFKYDF